MSALRLSAALLTILIVHICSAKTDKEGERGARQYGWPAMSPYSGHYRPWSPAGPSYYYDQSDYFKSFGPPYQPEVDPQYYDDEPEVSLPEQPATRYLSWNGKNIPDEDVKSRQNLFGLTNFNNAVNPFAQFFGSLPNLFMRNPEGPNYLNMYDNCTTPAGLSGVCVPAKICSALGHSPRGSCGLGLGITVCCVSTINNCGGQMTLNNTYWQNPPVLNTGSTCGLTVTLDRNLLEQKQAVCQVRLDFISFSIGQPDTTTVCSGDSFSVFGTTNNRVPTICGDNAGQHMYLFPPSSTSSIQLVFDFGSSNAVTRSWNIKVGFIPCGASYLAPVDCLQYYSAVTGSVRSFNFQDIALVAGTPRQLANQNYQICFRSEIVNGQQANRMCYTPCSNNGRNFVISGLNTGLVSGSGTGNAINSCAGDYLLIRDGFNSADPTKIADRYCGGALNPTASLGVSTTVCSSVKDFSLYYKTDSAEGTDTGNNGFCLTFTQTRV